MTVWSVKTAPLGQYRLPQSLLSFPASKQMYKHGSKTFSGVNF